MSTVSSVTSPDLYQLLQQTADNQGQASSTGSALPIATDSATETQAAPKHHHHHGGGGAGKLQSQIESAVTSALQNSTSSTDPNQIIQNAIASVLKANGADPTNPTTGTAVPANPSSTDPATTVTEAQQQQFNQLLQSYGVDPKQFQADFKAALQNTQGNNSPDFPTLFSSFPPGSAIDTTG